MLITKEKVLEIFREKVLEDYAIDELAINSEIEKWDEASRTKAQAAIMELIGEGFISLDAGWYHLTPKGAEYIRKKRS